MDNDKPVTVTKQTMWAGRVVDLLRAHRAARFVDLPETEIDLLLIQARDIWRTLAKVPAKRSQVLVEIMRPGADLDQLLEEFKLTDDERQAFRVMQFFVIRAEATRAPDSGA